MATADAYSTAAAYRSFITKTDTGKDADILTDLTTISRMLEQELGRVFNQSAAGEVRYFDTGTPLSDDDPRSRFLVTPRIYSQYSGLEIDDVVAVTELASDPGGDGTYEVIAAATDYNLHPYNAAIFGKPYTRLVLVSSPSVSIGGASKSVRITGTWGWPAVPGPIARATIELTAILRLESPRAQATVSEIGQLVTMSAQGRGIVDRLTREYSRKALIV